MKEISNHRSSPQGKRSPSPESVFPAEGVGPASRGWVLRISGFENPWALGLGKLQGYKKQDMLSKTTWKMPMLQVQVQRKQFERHLGQIHLLILKSFPGRQEATETPPEDWDAGGSHLGELFLPQWHCHWQTLLCWWDVNWCSTTENSMELPQQITYRTNIWSSSFTSGYLPKENKNTNSKRYIYPNVYSSVIYNS